MRGDSKQAIEGLIKRGKLTTVVIDDPTFLLKKEVEDYKPSMGGSPKQSAKRKSRRENQIRTLPKFDAKAREDYFHHMSTTADRIEQDLKSLGDADKVRLVESILTDLDRPDPEIDRIWAEEARKRWDAYKAGRLKTASYEEVMSKYRDQ